MTATFSVGLSQGLLGGGGCLAIEEGRLALEPSRLTRVTGLPVEVVHGRSDVVVAHRRLLPPFLSCAIPLTDAQGHVEAVASFPLWLRRPVVSALRSHGFTVTEVGRWLSLPDPPHRLDPGAP